MTLIMVVMIVSKFSLTSFGGGPVIRLIADEIQQAIRPHEDLLTTVKRCKLQWYGHVSCSSGLAKTILQGTVNG